VVEGNVEETNLPEEKLKVVWEILPGGNGHFFREISPEDMYPGLFSSDQAVDTANFPLIPYPVLNLADDYCDRTWSQTQIKINYDSSKWFGQYEL
jgi:hypothetical protein